MAIACFGAAKIFWDARTVLADLPRIRVGPDVLAVEGRPGEPVNFLLVGVDSSEGLDPNNPVRSGRDVVAEANGRFLSDTILLLRLDPATGDAAVLSIPRDLYVDVPGSSQWKINSTLLIGGMDKLIETINANLGVPVNHFVMVDFAGFSELVELVGGVPVYFPYPTRDAGSGLHVSESGCWILNGSESLAYVRARTIEEQIDGIWTRLVTPAPDLARIERQQEFMVLALEQALERGGADLTRISQFVEVGTQAVQLDETLTAGDLLDLAGAFRDYDTDALRVATLPVEPLFAEDGGYLGEQLRELEAADLLDVFRGEADGVRPADVQLAVSAGDSDQTRRVVDQFVARGFDASGASRSSATGPTVLRFASGSADHAAIVARYLELTPVLEVADIEEIELRIGADFAGIRSFPRPDADIRSRLDAARVESNTPRPSVPSSDVDTTSTDASNSAPKTPENAVDSTILPENPTVTVANATQPEISSSPPDVVIDRTQGPQTGAVPPTTIVRGRPPETVRCVTTGG